MAITEEHVVRLVVDDRDAKRGYDEATRSAKKYNKASDDVAKSQKKAAMSMAETAGQLLALKAILVDSIAVFAEQDAAQGRLDRAMRKANATAKDAKDIQNQLRVSQEIYGFAVVESRDAMMSLIQVTNDASVAQADFNLAMDIAGQENISLAQATEMLRKVRNGEVEEIKRLSGINKDLAADLNRIKDVNERAAETMRILQSEYAGARQETRGLSNDLEASKQNFDRVLGSVGSLVVELGKLTNVIGDGDRSLFGQFATGMEEFAKQAGEARKEIDRIIDGLSDATMLDFMQNKGLMQIGLEKASERDAMAAVGLSEATQQRMVDFYKKLATVQSEEARKALSDDFFAKEADRIRKESQRGPVRVTVQDVPDPVDEHNKPERKKRREASKRDAERRAEARARAKEQEEQARVKAMMDEINAEEEWKRQQAAWEAEEEREAERTRIEEERAEKLEREISLRERVAELQLAGDEVAARRLKIEESSLTPAEKRLELTRLEADESERAAAAAQQKLEADIQAIQAFGGALGTALELAGEEEAARRAVAAVDALVYQYKAIAAFGSPLTFGQGIAYQAAAIKAGAVAVGAVGGGGGGGGGGGAAASASRTPAPESSRESSRSFADEQSALERRANAGNTYILEFRSVKKPGPDEARIFMDTIEEESRRRGRV